MALNFKQFLYEELTNQQKRQVDSWPETRKPTIISGHIMPKGQNRITIPLDDPNDHVTNVHPDVETHLKNHGFEITDYKSGRAKDKYGRDTKIGKALNSTKAPEHVVKAFNLDPARNNASKVHNNLQVVISRHPYDVAGMSTDRGWTSCMDMDGGTHVSYLPDEVSEGTHVAYLTHKGDDNIKSPIARIALKPYREEKSDRNILLPERKTYGTAASSFEHTVNSFINNHFPMKENTFYTKNSKVYDDSGFPDKTNDLAARVDTITPEKINHLMKPSGSIQEHKSKVGKINYIAKYGDKEQREQLAFHSPKTFYEARAAAAKFGNQDLQDRLVEDPHPVVQGAITEHGTDAHRTLIMSKPDLHPSVLQNIATYGNDQHRDILVHHSNPLVQQSVALYGNKEHRKLLFNHPDQGVRNMVKMNKRTD